MAVNKLLCVYIAFDVLFALGGAAILVVAIMTQMSMKSAPKLSTIATDILLAQCPLTAGIVNAALVFVTFLLSVPALIFPTNRTWLKLHGWFVVLSAMFTLVLGLDIWFDTLKTRANMAIVWAQQTPEVQSLLQQRLTCCGFDITSKGFQTDQTCPSALVAAQKGGCISKFSTFANGYLDLIFTADFGIVALDVLLLLCVAMLLKDRKERERYKMIDAKNGFGPI